MRKYRTTIIAVVLLVVVIAAFVIALNVKDKGGDGNEPGTATTAPSSDRKSVALFDFRETDVIGFSSFFNENYEVSILKEADEENDATWKCDSHSDLVVENDSVNAIVNSVSKLKGIAIENVEDTTEYGFWENKSKVYFTTELKDGKTETMYIGDIDAATGNYYFVMVEGKPDTVYKVYKSYAADFMIEKGDLINLKIFSFTTDDTRKEFLVYKENELAFEAESSEVDEQGGAVWKVTEPAVRDGLNSDLNARIDAMRNITLDGLSEEKCEDLSKYGLHKPLIEYRLTVLKDGQRVTHRIAIGDKTADGSCYYCIIDDTGDVYTVSTSSIYRDFNPMAFMDTYIFMENTDEVKELNLTIGDRSYELRFEYDKKIVVDETTGEEKEELLIERFFNGKNAIDDDTYSIVTSDSSFRVPGPDEDLDFGVTSSNPRDCFQHVFLSLYAITYAKFDFDEPAEKGEVIMTAEYLMTDGSVNKIEYAKRDSTTAYVYINGEYADGYCETTSIYGNDYAMADVTASIKALETVMKIVP